MRVLWCAFLIAFLLITNLSHAQDASSSSGQSKAAFIPASQRLTAAKTAFVKGGEGSEIPYNVITDGLQGWGRYTLVESPKKADIIVEIYAPEDPTTTFSSTTTTNRQTGRPEQSSSSSRELSVGQVRMVVQDAKSGMTLWTGSEQPKGGFKRKTQNDNLVAASEKLISKFRDRVEPVPAQ